MNMILCISWASIIDRLMYFNHMNQLIWITLSYAYTEQCAFVIHDAVIYVLIIFHLKQWFGLHSYKFRIITKTLLRVYEKRKMAALEVERIVRELVAKNDIKQVKIDISPFFSNFSFHFKCSDIYILARCTNTEKYEWVWIYCTNMYLTHGINYQYGLWQTIRLVR